MAQLPFPITAETLEDLRFQFSEIIREIYEENVGGLYLGDVFSDGGDYLTLDLDSTGGLEKDGGELQVKCKSDGGIGTSSAGTYVQCKAFGGLDTDSSGLYIKSAVVKGYREGLLVTIKDADELYVSSGAIEICGATYSASTTITVSLGTVSANTLYYLYVSAPATDTTLAAGQFSVSSTAPAWSDAYGAYYKTGDATKRLLAKYYINSIGVSKVIDDRRVGIGMDSDNVLNDEELLAYDTLIGGFKGVEKSTDGTLADNSDNAIPTEKAVKTYADTMVTKATFNANTILKADSDDTPEALTVGEQTLVGRITDGEIAALSASQVRTLLDVPTNAEAVLDTLFNANTILKADSDDTPEALTVGEGTIVGRAAGGEITALDNVTRGHREGLRVTIKDADELYVSGGTIEINGTVYESEAQLTVSLSGVSANTLYYLYVAAPGSGLTLTASEITVSATAPTFDDARGAYYKTADTTKRLLAKYYQAGGGMVLTASGTNGGHWNQRAGGKPEYPPSYPTLPVALSNDYRSFVMFPSVGLPPGDTITSATLTMKTNSSGSRAPSGVDIYFNDADTAALPVTFADTQALAYTTAKTAWNFATVAHSTVYTSPDIAAAIQEVIDRPGWSYGNNLMFILVGNDYGESSAGPRFLGTSSAAPPYITMVIGAIGVSKVIDDRRVGIGMDSDNVLNDEELLAYDTLIGGFKGVEKSTDGTLADNSDNAIPTEKAVKTYADTMVTKATYNANTILKADADDTPEALTVGEQTLVGRITGGEIAALTPTQVRTMLDLYTDDEVTFAELNITGKSALGSLRVGSATNYNEICAAGIQSYHGATAKCKLTLRPVLVEKTSKAGGVPDQVYRGLNVGYSLPIWSSDDEELYWRMRIPVRWDGTTDPQFGICCSLAGAAGEDVGDHFKFSLEWQTTNKGDVMGTTTSVCYSEQTVLAGRNAQYDTYFCFFTLNADDATNPLKAGEMLQARVRRVDATDPDITGEVIIWDWASIWPVDKTYGPWTVSANDA